MVTSSCQLVLHRSKRVMWYLQCCLLVQAVAIRASYYHEPSMTTIQPPAPLIKDSFFGFSIAFHDKRLVASAPRADKDGQLFSCDLATKSCARMTVPINATTSRVDDKKHHYDHHFWLGANVKATVKDDEDYLFVCAPRSTSNIKIAPGGIVKYSYFGTNGRCYYKSSTQSQFTNMVQITNEDRSINITRSENATDSFGWSMDIDLKGGIRVGSPAIAAGRVITYDDPEEANSVDPKFLGAANPDGFTFGYSIASGVFIRSGFLNKPQELPGVAIGSPYGDYGVGKVFFYDNDQKLQWVVDDPARGVGSMFGAALCSAQIDGRTTSLLVGAPAHFSGDDKYHTGVVYVYRHDVTTRNTIKKVNQIEGNKNGAFFGYAIANMGDMDQDGKDEIAIGAPYEDEAKGAVYLYAGSSLSDGSDATYIQKLQPEAAAFQNLGLSLVANKYSDSACSDLAIGAPGNDSVAVFHCLTVIAVDVQTKVLNLQNRTDKTSFTFDLCLNAKYPPKPERITAKFAVKVKLTHPNATLTDATASNDFFEYVAILDNIANPFGCRKIRVTTSEDGDYEQEIQFNITAKLLDDPAHSTEFDSSKATVSSNSNLTVAFPVRAAECKQKICKPALTVHVTSKVENPYMIGSSKTERVSVHVLNGNADTAYRPCVRLSVTGDATVHSAPPHCKFDGERQRICQLQRPLKPNSNWTASNEEIELDLTGLTSRSEDILLKVEVFNRCETRNNPDDSDLITFNLITNKEGLKIESKTDQGETVAFHKEDFTNGKILHHTYTISNLGEINWVGIYCDLWLYREDYITYNHSIQIYSGDSERPPCVIKRDPNSTSNFHGLSCELGSLFRKEAITVVIPITTVPGALEKVLEKSNATVKTFLRVMAHPHEKERTELTTLMLQEGTVPVWVIVVAVLVGILIVLLIAFALYECGLLRRKKKEELVQLKKEVKRKSMVNIQLEEMVNELCNLSRKIGLELNYQNKGHVMTNSVDGPIRMLQRQSMRLTDSARAELRNRTYRELLDAAEIKEAEEAEETRKSQLACNTRTKEQGTKGHDNAKKSTAIQNEPSGSHFDIRAHIEKTLRENPKGLKKDKESTSLI